MKNTKTILILIFWLILPQLFGIVGAIVTAFSVTTWYPTLIKSPLNPPSWVFGPVWTILFLFMGIAAYYVWSERMDPRVRKDDKKVNKDVKIALSIFIGQLVLNTLWSIIFFGLHNPGWALVEIFVLWLAIVATIVAFNKVSKLAAIILIPYLLWVSFAIYLNYSVWKLNPPETVAMIQQEGIQVPPNYTLESYKVEKVLDQACQKNGDCELPFEYAVRSNCPYVAPCLKNKCTVVCPTYKDIR